MDKLSPGSCAQYHCERARRATSTRSSSGRRRSPTAATARTTAWTTRSGSRPGLSSRAEPQTAGPPSHGRPGSASPGSSGGIAGRRRSCSSLRRCSRSSSSTSRRSWRCSSRRSGRSTRSRRRSSTLDVDNYRQLWNSSVYRDVDAAHRRHRCRGDAHRCVLAFPLAYFMARVAGGRSRALLFVAVLLPLWSSYLVRVYVWRLILDDTGVLNWTLQKVGLPAANIGYSNWAVWLVFTYIWLPFMILPVYARARAHPGLVPRGLARPRRRRVHAPSARRPAARAAGGRRRLDLHVLADARRLHHAAARRRRLVAVHRQRRLRPDRLRQRAFAAAFAVVPLAVMGVYLLIARKLGAFEAL